MYKCFLRSTFNYRSIVNYKCYYYYLVEFDALRSKELNTELGKIKARPVVADTSGH